MQNPQLIALQREEIIRNIRAGSPRDIQIPGYLLNDPGILQAQQAASQPQTVPVTPRDIGQPPSEPTGTQAPTMDLGTLVFDLARQAGTAAIQREFTQVPQVTTPVNWFTEADGGVGLPGVDVIAQSPGAGYVYKQVCGQWKWVKKTRRRRKRLATKSDLSDLASLKGILGQGKAFEVWIATHS